MLIVRYEIPVLIGLAYCVLCQTIKNLNLRYLAIYGVGTLVAYSIVSYKTPWCVINIAWPFLFLFGAAILAIPSKYRMVGNVIATLALCVSLGYAIWLNYFRFTNDTEPYVYVQTYKDINRLTQPLLKLAHRNPIYYQLIGHMVRTSAYPFPWILGDFPRVGYYEHDSLPDKVDADFLLVQEDRIEAVEKQLHDSYYTMPLTIRPYQDTSKLYLSAKTFKAVFPGSCTGLSRFSLELEPGMKWLSGGLTFVNFATLFGLFLGMIASGLGRGTAILSICFGCRNRRPGLCYDTRSRVDRNVRA